MFYYLILKKFVCISKWGKISDIESIEIQARKKISSHNNTLTSISETYQDLDILIVNRLSAFRPG